MKVFVLLCMSFFFLKTEGLHPVHVSIINLNYENHTGEITYSLRVNRVDFQYIINTLYGVELSFNNQTVLKPNQKEAIEKYLNSRFEIFSNENKANAGFVNWMLENELLCLNFNAKINASLSKFEITNTLMLDAFTDQQNLLIFAADSFEKGFTFTGEIKKQVINL